MAAGIHPRTPRSSIIVVFSVVILSFVVLSVCVSSCVPSPFPYISETIGFSNNCVRYGDFHFNAFYACGFNVRHLQLRRQPLGRPPRRRSRRAALSKSFSVWNLLALLVLLAGDVSLNPGPDIQLYYQNVRSLQNKLSILSSHYSDLCFFDVIALCETWLSDRVGDSELELAHSHQLFRRDRCSRGGGVLLAINSTIPATRRFDLETECEIVWVEIRLEDGCGIRKKKLFIGCFYRPPSSDVSVLEACLESVLRVHTHGDLILLGDFNLPITWSSQTSGISADNNGTFLIDHFIDGMGLFQCNPFPTRNLATLDLILSSFSVNSPTTCRNIFNSDHSSLEFSLPMSLPHRNSAQTSPPARSVKSWKKADWEAINYTLSLLPWGLLESGSPEDAMEVFYDFVHGVTNDFVPSRRISKKKPMWLTAETSRVLQNKRAAWKLWKSFPNPHTYASFSSLRRVSRNLLRRDYSNSIKSITDDMASNPKRFWSLFNSKRKSTRIPTIVKSGQESFSGVERPSAFNKYFSSNFTPPTPQFELPTLNPVCSHSLTVVSVTPEETLRLLESLPSNKATGADGLGSLFLHRTADTLHIPLCALNTNRYVKP
ncbi:uncharacterized protein LOC124171300 [Ischnura elegans]|uniref:uncharacterized protein LOC124171300 n=1 Tax=Ischnura elegans TaxID=197161 RepID=UPI001ED8B580|nr:uncharacterized protein LOC124171300 [Ischnura elegans]